MAAVLCRLDKIESVIGSLSNTHNTTAGSIIAPPSPVTSPVYQGYWPTVGTTAPSKQSVHGFRIPSMLVFETVCPRHSRWTYDYSQHFYDDQLRSISDLSVKLRMPTTPPDLSRPRVLALQDGFMFNVLLYLPVVDLATYHGLVKQAADTDFEAVHPSTCFALLTCALGSRYQDSPLHITETSGFGYFSKAMLTFDKVSGLAGDLIVLQCQILIA